MRCQQTQQFLLAGNGGFRRITKVSGVEIIGKARRQSVWKERD
jgi:hypothetical protein